MGLLSKWNSHIFSIFSKISYTSPVQLVLFKILEYSRECKIPNSKISNSTYCITQDRQSGIMSCHSWPTPILNCLLFSFLKTLYFAKTDCFSYQYIIYYIPFESSDFPLSNVFVIKVKFHIFSTFSIFYSNILFISSAITAIQNIRI